MREHWRELDYWRWFWRDRLSFRVRAGLAMVLLALLLGGGWFAAERLTAANAGVAGTDSFVLETTVQQLVTVPGEERVVREVVPGRTVVRTQTRYEARTNVVSAPGRVVTVRRVVESPVPAAKEHVVTVNGKVRTVVQTRLVPTTTVQTRTLVVTSQQTVTETGPSVTETTTRPAVTVTQTRTETVESPPETVTRTVTETETVTTGPSLP